MNKKLYLNFSLLVLSFFVFMKCSSNVTNPVVRNLTPLEKKVASSSDEFGFKLFKKVNEFEGEKNIFISPLSISMALGMTLNGANGSTYDAMQATLELSSLTNQQINESYKSLINLLTQIDPKVKFDIANSIWYKNDITFEKEFIDVNKKYFNAEVDGLDFQDPNSVNIINNWVSDNTNEKIKTIVDEIPSDAIMYLINAIYFKGTWKYEFDKSNTRDEYFQITDDNKVSCKMMIQTNKFMYYGNSDLQAIDLPYGDGQFSMTVILPNENKNVDEIIKELNQENWDSWIDNLQEQEGTLQLPKFKLEFKYELKEVLNALGMGIAFGSSADFTNLYKPGGVYISKVKHKTFIDVYEEGTEAAAVTLVEMKYTSTGGGSFNLKVDRPFIFVIRESSSGSLLFMGKIIKPLLD